jgi:hypothetical protein
MSTLRFGPPRVKVTLSFQVHNLPALVAFARHLGLHGGEEVPDRELVRRLLRSAVLSMCKDAEYYFPPTPPDPPPAA